MTSTGSWQAQHLTESGNHGDAELAEGHTGIGVQR